MSQRARVGDSNDGGQPANQAPSALKAVRKPPREPGEERAIVHEEVDTEPEIDWDKEMADHKDEYLGFPAGFFKRADQALADFFASGDYDEYPEDWIARSNRIAAQEMDD